MYHRYIYNFGMIADAARYFPIDTLLCRNIGVWTDLETGLNLKNEAGNTVTFHGDGVITFVNNDVETTIDSHSYDFGKQIKELVEAGRW